MYRYMDRWMDEWTDIQIELNSLSYIKYLKLL